MLRKFIFKPGINREITDYAQEGGWYSCNKVRVFAVHCLFIVLLGLITSWQWGQVRKFILIQVAHLLT